MRPNVLIVMADQVRADLRASEGYPLDTMPHLDAFAQELHNLWDDPASAAVKTDMLQTLVTEILKATDPLPAPHGRYRVKVHPKGYWHDEAFVAADPGIRQPEGRQEKR